MPLMNFHHNKFEWMPYSDSRIEEYILTDFFVNCNIWHKCHRLKFKARIIAPNASDEGLLFRWVSFGLFRQNILPSPQKLKDLHKIGLHGRTDEDWPKFCTKYIYIWKHKYNFIPLCEPVLPLDLATFLNYMTWFRFHGNPYLLLEEERSKQHHRRRPRQPYMRLQSCLDRTIISSNPI
ncbi:hypothetical protein J1N35_005010 [Gossypium stocksii]|uniref:Aminotransferase-like plant mobile domain-containing protein n=1 Tax=Gossypium stocksii TaxID=47602 RepID=A0A9D4AIV6_9ROSI|nr:hypothetical protein J1N35_005010 [Gossypium stocksii]